MQIRLQVNGQTHSLDIPSHHSLLDVLREELDLTGSKRGCDRGECGSCTVLLDGKPVYSCITLAAQVRGRSVVTVEGLANDGQLDPVQQAFLDRGGDGSGDMRFATSVAGFGMLLRESAYAGDYALGDVLDLARRSLGDDEEGYRREFIRLVREARAQGLLKR